MNILKRLAALLVFFICLSHTFAVLAEINLGTGKINVIIEEETGRVSIRGSLDDFELRDMVAYSAFRKSDNRLIHLGDSEVDHLKSFAFEDFYVESSDGFDAYVIYLDLGKVTKVYDFGLFLPDEVGSESIKNVVSKLKSMMPDELAKYYESIYSFSGLDNSESKAFRMLIDAKKKDELAAALINNLEGVNTKTDLQEVIESNLKLIATRNLIWSDVQDILINEFKIFSEPTVKAAEYSILSSSKKDEVFRSIAGKTYNTDYDLYQSINDAIEKVKVSLSGGGTGVSRPSLSGGINIPIIPDQVENEPDIKSKYNDIDSVPWAIEAIENLSARNIVNGYGEGLFKPNESITRAEFVAIMVKAFNIDSGDSYQGFEDVNETEWFYPFIKATASKGIILGNDGYIMPNDYITREDMCVILQRYLNADGTSLITNFNDNEAISDYAKNAVAYLSSIGVINGVGKNMFAPKALSTRAETCVVIQRLLK